MYMCPIEMSKGRCLQGALRLEVLKSCCRAASPLVDQSRQSSRALTKAGLFPHLSSCIAHVKALLEYIIFITIANRKL